MKSPRGTSTPGVRGGAREWGRRLLVATELTNPRPDDLRRRQRQEARRMPLTGWRREVLLLSGAFVSAAFGVALRGTAGLAWAAALAVALAAFHGPPGRFLHRRWPNADYWVDFAAIIFTVQFAFDHAHASTMFPCIAVLFVLMLGLDKILRPWERTARSTDETTSNAKAR